VARLELGDPGQALGAAVAVAFGPNQPESEERLIEIVKYLAARRPPLQTPPPTLVLGMT
jgi:hypothetical protein